MKKTYDLTDIERHERNWLQATDLLAPLFSTCERRQFLAVVLAPNKRVCGIGYNGGPSGMAHCDEGGCPHSRDGKPSGGSYDTCIAQHAETGALLWSDPAMRLGGTIIVNGVPCFHCAKQIASSGLARVVFWSEPGYPSEDQTLDFLDDAGIEVMPVQRPRDSAAAYRYLAETVSAPQLPPLVPEVNVTLPQRITMSTFRAVNELVDAAGGAIRWTGFYIEGDK